jgi:hypothetical protein
MIVLLEQRAVNCYSAFELAVSRVPSAAEYSLPKGSKAEADSEELPQEQVHHQNLAISMHIQTAAAARFPGTSCTMGLARWTWVFLTSLACLRFELPHPIMMAAHFTEGLGFLWSNWQALIPTVIPRVRVHFCV